MSDARHREFRLRDVAVLPRSNTLLAGGERLALRPASMQALLVLAAHAPEFVGEDELCRETPVGSGLGPDALAKALGKLESVLGDLIESDPARGYRLTVEPDTTPLRFIETDFGPIRVEPLHGLDEGDYLLQTKDGPVRLHPLPGQDQGFAGRWFDELKRRRVFRSMATYAVIAWLILQIVDVLSGALPVPDWTLTVTVVFLATGFPVAATLSWFYQVGSRPVAADNDEVRGDVTVDRARLVHHIDLVIIVFLVAVVGFLSWGRIFPLLNPDEQVTVAVLPLDNLSGDEEDRYLSEGLADDIRSRLADVPQFVVAARLSSRTLANQDLDVRAIGERLGVEHIVEGSMRRAGDSIRVNLQLVDVETGFSRWQKIYDTDLADVLPMQNRISLTIASELRVALTSELREMLAQVPTSDPVAYDLYLRANHYLDLPRSSENLAQALVLFEEAIARDGTFALGYAGLCRTNIERFQHTSDTAFVELAESECNNALALDDGLSTVHTALGELNLLGGELDEAERWFQSAIDRDEIAVDAYTGLGEVYAKKNEPEQAEVYFRNAIGLRPGNWNGFNNYARFLLRQGQLEAAIQNYQRAIELAPDNAHGYNNLGVIYFMQGRFDEAAESYRQSLELNPGRAAYSNTGTMYYYAGDYAEAVGLFRRAAEEATTDYRLWGNLADAQRFVDAPEEDAPASYRRAIELANRQLEINPSDAETLTNVAWYYANLGEAPKARDALDAALPAAADNPTHQYIAALVYVLLDDIERAQSALDKAASLGFPETIIEATPDFEGTPLIGT